MADKAFWSKGNFMMKQGPDGDFLHRTKAVKVDGRLFVEGPFHQDALNLFFKGWSEHRRRRFYERVIAGKSTVVFGTAFSDGTGWVEDPLQEARKEMYGFKD